MKLLKQINKLPKSVKFACIALVMLFVYLSVAKIDIVSPGTGVITGSEDKIDIISPGSGFINKFDLKSGNEVKPGQLLFSYTNLDSYYKEKSLSDLVAFSKQRITQLKTDLDLLNILKLYEFSASPPAGDNLDDNTDQAATASASADSDQNAIAENLPAQPDEDSQDQSASVSNNQQIQHTLALLDEKFSHYTQDQSLSAFKFYQEYKSIIDEKENQSKRKVQTSSGISELTTQIALLNNKNSLLKKSGAPQVDIISTSADISKIRSQIIQEKISLLALENDMLRSKRDFDDRLLSRIYDADQQLEKLNKEQIENTGELALLKSKIQSNSVEAPVNGVVLDIVKNFAAGSYVEQSQLIMKLKKKQVKKVIEARFDAKYRPFIYDNGIVKVVINTPGYKKYYTGHIEKISVDSFTDEQTHLTSRFYKVEIRVDNDNFNRNNNSEGIQVSVYAISKRMTIINYLTALVNSNIVFNVW